MSIFDRISGEYKDKALVQYRAAVNLLELLHLADGESVLDVACGPGHLSDFISQLTKGRVTGTDISSGMIEKARRLYPQLEFVCIPAEELDYADEFDMAFCNSALMWFTQPAVALQAIHKALRTGGRLGLANPATKEWSPWFSRIIAAVTARPDIRPVFAHWNDPWFFLPSEEAYRELFEGARFRTEHLQIVREVTEYSVEEACNIYLSGAANGFAGKMFYSVPVADDYISRFNQYVREEIEKMARDSRVRVEFNRLYYVGRK